MTMLEASYSLRLHETSMNHETRNHLKPKICFLDETCCYKYVEHGLLFLLLLSTFHALLFIEHAMLCKDEGGLKTVAVVAARARNLGSTLAISPRAAHSRPGNIWPGRFGRLAQIADCVTLIS